MDVDFDNFNLINSIKGRKSLGEGSGRIVYDLENGYVAKVAKNKKGIAQNKVEYDIYSDDQTGIFAKIINASKDFRYIVVEKAEKIKDFRPVWNYFKVKNHKQLFQVKVLREVCSKYHMSTADLESRTSWGLINGVPTIIDYGLTNQVYMKYYFKSRLIDTFALLLFMNKLT